MTFTVEKEKEENEINLEGIIPGNNREDLNWQAATMYAQKLEHALEKWQNDHFSKVAFQKSEQMHKNRK